MTAPVSLTASTGDASVDALLQRSIEAYLKGFPGRVLGTYVLGSYADGTSVAGSDIDGFMVFEGALTAEERERGYRLAATLNAGAPPDFDMSPVSESWLMRQGHVQLKFASLHVYGEDIRERVPLPDIEYYVRVLAHQTLRFLARIREGALAYPLEYPQPRGDFFGYDVRELRAPDGTAERGMKELINIIGKPAQAIVTAQARVHVRDKSDCLVQYREKVGDEWTALIEQVYVRVRGEWGYRIPEGASERAELRGLCEQTLAFENHYMRFYRDFLLRELRGEQETSLWLDIREAAQIVAPLQTLRQEVASGTRQAKNEGGEELVLVEHIYPYWAARALTQIAYPDDTAITNALEELTESDDAYLRGEAYEAVVNQLSF